MHIVDTDNKKKNQGRIFFIVVFLQLFKSFLFISFFDGKLTVLIVFKYAKIIVIKSHEFRIRSRVGYYVITRISEYFSKISGIFPLTSGT